MNIKICFFAIAGLVLCAQTVAEEIQQYFMTHIIFQPLIQSIDWPSENLSSGVSNVIQNGERKSISRTMILRKVGSGQGEIEITYPDVENLRLSVFLSNGLVEKIVRYENEITKTFVRIVNPTANAKVGEKNLPHKDFSIDRYDSFYKQEEFDFSFNGDLLKMTVNVYSIRQSSEVIELLFKVEREDFFRVIQFKGCQLMSTEHLAPRKNSSNGRWLLLVAHFHRYRDRWFPGDFYTFNKNGEIEIFSVIQMGCLKII